MSGDPADRTTATGACSTKKHILVSSFPSPGANLLFALSKGKGWRVLEDVTLEHPKRVLDIDRTLAFDTGAAISSYGQTIFQRFVQPLIDALDELFLCMLSHGPIVARKQVPWRIQSKQRHRLETFLPKLGGKNAVIGQCMAIDFAWCFVRQPPAARLIVAEIHLFVAFVAVKGSAPCLTQLIFLGL